MQWLHSASTATQAGTSVVIVRIRNIAGSTPRGVEAAMTVSQDRQWDSIGGGRLEHDAISHARTLLKAGESGITEQEIILGPDLGQCCGGRVTLEYQTLIVRAIAVFGLGHVAAALLPIVSGLGYTIHAIDAREEAWAQLPDVPMIKYHDPIAAVAQLPAKVPALVMTHCHQLDYQLVEALLQRDCAAAVGLIGSKSKAARFRSRLTKANLQQAMHTHLMCPIGDPRLPGKKPMAVALSIAAMLQQDTWRANHNTTEQIIRDCGSCQRCDTPALPQHAAN